MIPSPTAILDKARASLKWSVLSEIVSRTAQPIVFVLLAKLLTPHDYGVLGTAMICLTFCQMFWEAGLSKALVQIKEAPIAAAQVVFWTNVVLGLGVYLIVFLTAPYLASVFKTPEAVSVLRVFGLQIILASLSSVQQALLLREFDFRRLFWVRLVTAFIPGLFSIPLAAFGYGVWALVVGTLVGQFANLVLLWKSSTWRPRFQFDVELAGNLFRFGIWVVFESIAAWCIQWGDNVVVGRFLGIEELGVYRTGSIIVTIVFGLILNPIVPVMYPTFSKLQDDLPTLTSTFLRVNRIIFTFALPIGMGLFLIGSDISSTVFGAKWQGLGMVISILGLMNGIAWLVGLNAELYRAMGRPDVNSKLMFAQLSFYLPAFYFAAQHSFEAFLLTRLGVAIVATPIHVFLCVKMLKVSPLYIWRQGRAMIVSAGLMAVTVLLLKEAIFPNIPALSNWLYLLLVIISGAATYAVALWCLDREFVTVLRDLFRRRRD